jgi:GntR family transcriptional regulator / MocR family aminotransferase
MFPFKTMLNLERNSKTPLFLQIANGLIENIRTGVIGEGRKLLGTRAMSVVLEVHRQTVVAAYDELLAQGWIETRRSSGTFVRRKLLQFSPIALNKDALSSAPKIETGFALRHAQHLALPLLKGSTALSFDDGFPDTRLMPSDVLARAFREVLKKGYQKNLLFYGETKGELSLRLELVRFLNETRGLNITTDNIMLTRGSIMGIYLTTQVLVEAGDNVAVSTLGYGSGNLVYENKGANLILIRTDEYGLDVEHLAEICREKPLRMVYVTPHHHYPTTVTMPVARRLQLLKLAQEYGFAVLEDDYDYDFHYASSPILPLASVDTQGFVVYVGSVCKSVSPALRIGYVVAPAQLIEEMGQVRRIIDRQGDNLTEAAFALMIREGDFKRHLKKAQRIYHKRRDLFCELISTTPLSAVLEFKKPAGGMAVWAQFDPQFPIEKLSERAEKKGLKIANGKAHGVNAVRLGFASSNETELELGVNILKTCF